MATNTTIILDWYQNDYCLVKSFRFPICSQHITLVSFSLIVSFVAIIILSFLILNKHQSDLNVPLAPNTLQYIHQHFQAVQNGSKKFLASQLIYLFSWSILVMSILIILYSIDPPSNSKLDGLRYGMAFLMGTIVPAIAGYICVHATTKYNVVTLYATLQDGLATSLQKVYTGGLLAGLFKNSMPLLGISLFYFFMTLGYSTFRMEDTNDGSNQTSNMVVNTFLTPGQISSYSTHVLASFSFGVSSYAMFTRVGGGIFAKAIDVASEAVGHDDSNPFQKVIHNPALLSRHIGDHIGNVSGIGADLMESFIGSIVAASILGSPFLPNVALPFWIAASGLLASFLSSFFVTTYDDASQKDLLWALNKGYFFASILLVAFSAVITSQFYYNNSDGWLIFGCIAVGILCGTLIQQATEYFTSFSFWPIQSMNELAVAVPSTIITQGMGVGMVSTAAPVLIIVGTVIVCYTLASGFGVAMAAVGMISTIGTTLATSAYSPIAGNCHDIATAFQLETRVRETTDSMNALGSTSSAVGKGFAIGSSVLTAVALISAFKKITKVVAVDLGDSYVMSGLLLGAMLPFLFAALTLFSVQKTAKIIIVELRKQIADIEGQTNDSKEPDFATFAKIAGRSSVEELILPGIYAVLSPVAIGLLIGPAPLAGMLTGAISSGIVLSYMMTNSGSAWSNVRKYDELNTVVGDGEQSQKASAKTDTDGYAFKDKTGSAVNILMKLMCNVSLTIAPIIANRNNWELWYFAFIPIGLIAVVTFLVYFIYWRTMFDISESLELKSMRRTTPPPSPTSDE